MNDWQKISLLSLSFMPALRAPAADLPVPCIAGSCGPVVTGFITSGSATATSTSNLLRIEQQTDKAILNWASFDVAAGNRVEFHQPDSQSVALNRIYQASPSRIFGAVEANGQVYLVNQNGMLFGNGSRVKTAGLIASTLDISDANFAAGLVSPSLLLNSTPALASDGRAGIIGADGNLVRDANGDPLAVQLVVEEGAQLSTSGTGGRILLASRDVLNAGSISTPEGQTVLAAGEKVYLAASADPALRGLYVEVNSGGTAWNRLTGQINANAGNVTIVGLAVNQDGRVSATSTVAANGSIRLLARDTVQFTRGAAGDSIEASKGGSLILGTDSRTTVLPDLNDTALAVADQAQLPSTVELSGRQVLLQSGSQVVAPGGVITVSARVDPRAPGEYDAQARIRVHDGATIDVSGTDALAPVTRNLVSVELRANELKDSPLQRDGVLRGKTVIVDARVGTPLADVGAAIANIPRSIAERTSTGGTVQMQSDGDVVIMKDATVDVSGGSIQYTPGEMQTTLLVDANGQLVDIGKASPDVLYTGLVNPSMSVTYDRWGVTESISGPRLGYYDPGYVEGRNAGTLQISADVMALNGRLLGSALAGDLQRDPSLAPLGGLLRIGSLNNLGALPDYQAPSISLVDVPRGLAIADTAQLPTGRTLELPVAFLKEGGFTRADLSSNGVISLDLDEPLTLQAGTSLNLIARRIELLSDIIAPAGSVTATSVLTTQSASPDAQPAGIKVGDGVTLDVGGQWINDQLKVLQSAQLANLQPLFIDGGRIDLGVETQGAALEIGDGVNLLANAGGWLQSSGKTKGGKGGGLRLAASHPDTKFDIGRDVRVEGYGVNGAAGGSITIEAARVGVREQSSWALAQSFDPLDASRALQIGTGLFSDHGFSGISLVATGASPSEDSAAVLTIAAGSQISLHPQTRQTSEAAINAPTGSTVADFTTLRSPFAIDEAPATLRLETRPTVPTFGTDMGTLVIEAGASIDTPSGSTIQLVSPGGMQIAGQIRSPGGHVSATTPTPVLAFDKGYEADLAINVAPTALIDVSGTVLDRPNDIGLRLGTVTGGGSIDLIANRGAVNLLAGAWLRADGASSVLDMVDPLNPAAGYLATPMTGAGGSILLRAPESLLVLGNLSARAGSGGENKAPGGSFTAQLTRDRGFDSALSIFPSTPRELQLTTFPVTVSGVLPSGQGYLDVRTISNAGFDAVSIESGNTIETQPGVALNFERRLSLDAPELNILGGGSLSLSAPYVSLGRARPFTGVVPVSVPGTGTLSVAGDLIDLVGNLTVSGVAAANISSTGDLRLRGIESSGVSTGTLRVAGDITLASARTWPTTATQFEIRAEGGLRDLVQLEQTGKSDGTPLSANGEVSIVADQIRQNGTLLAPFGRISLSAADQVSFGAGSVTSVSAAGTTIPYGSVELGEWQYLLGGSVVPQPQLPERRIDVAADSVVMDEGSVLDLEGGGDLYAYEWIPGTGGTKDALASDSSNLYVVFPGMRNQSGVYDPQEFQGSSLQPGDSIYLAGNSLLEEGVYPLLPARYALLPGAVLVEAVPKYANLAKGIATQLPDGTPVVAGRRVLLDTGIGDSLLSGFALRPGSAARSLASYTDFQASTFYPERAAQNDLPRASIPADAGALGINIGSRLALDGRLETTGAASGRNAYIDIAAPELQVLTNPNDASAGAVGIDAADLSSLKAGSLLLGASRAGGADTITLVADRVLIGDGVTLSGDEILLAANKDVRVSAGARVSSASPNQALDAQSKADAIKLAGQGAASGALVGVSDLRRLAVERDGTSLTAATVSVDEGAVLRSGSSLLVSAPGGGYLSGQLQGAGAFWDVSSQRLSIADTLVGGSLTLSDSNLQALTQGLDVRLASDTTIDFWRSAQIGNTPSQTSDLRDLTVQAGALRAMGQDIVVGIGSTRNLTLAGAASTVATATQGSGSLNISSGLITLDEGTLQLAGFGQASLDAGSGIRGNGVGTLLASGALDLRAPLYTAAAGATTAIIGSGTLDIRGSTSSASAPADAGGLGGALEFTARTIATSGARFALPAGQLGLHAQENLSITSTEVDAGGRQVTINDRVLAADAGAISLESGGSLSIDSASSLNVAAVDGGAAGQIQVRAGGAAVIDAQLRGSAAGGTVGGSFTAAVDSLPNFSQLNDKLEAGGFTGDRDIGLRTGDLTLSDGEVIHARSVRLATDSGSLTVSGSIEAQSADSRASVELYGGSGVTLTSSGSITAAGIGADSRGGLVTLASATGPVNMETGSRISTPGGLEAGEVLVRAPIIGNDAAVTAMGTQFSDVAQVSLEAFMSFDVGPTLNAAGMNTYRTALSTFFANSAPGLLSRLGSVQGTTLHLTPGLQLNRTGDLSIGALDLSTWRFGGEAANIAFLASGSISVTGTISDGLATSTIGGRSRVSLPSSASGSLLFAAGSTLRGADPLAVLTAGTSDFRLAQNVIIRTATGDIGIASANDIIFGSGSSVYTAGLLKSAADNRTNGPGFAFAGGGGQVSLSAGRDVIGSPVSQAVGEWQPRTGRAAGIGTSQILTKWGVDIARFGWNVGSLGGGDVRISAGRDVLNLSAAAADSAVRRSSTDFSWFRGGVLDVSAGRDISSLYAHVSHGVNRVVAGGALGRVRSASNGEALGSLFSVQDASLAIRARTGIALESVFNPTVIAQPGAAADLRSYFFTYGDDSRLDVVTTAGDLELRYADSRVGTYLGVASTGQSIVAGNPSAVFAILPPTVKLWALSADVDLAGSINIYPSDRGQLDIAAARDIDASAGGAVVLSDGLQSVVPTRLTPASTVTAGLQQVQARAASARHVGDPVPTRVSAGRDILGGNFFSAKAESITAGRDIVNANFVAQNLSAADTTSIVAGRDIRYSSSETTGRIEVAGDGALTVIAGRNIDLGYSQGISTIGALANAQLPKGDGADLSVVVGVADGFDSATFVDEVLAPSSEYQTLLTDYMKARLGLSALSFAEAKSAFLSLDTTVQLPVISAVFFSELVRSGREVNKDPSLGFDRGYAAIDKLFPGSRSDATTVPTGTKRTYRGDLSLAFSRIYTLAGGTVSLFVPGGILNVGLANPPANVSISRAPSDLGIVAQGAGDVRVFTNDDVLVNQSRMFTLGGGDISVWSTTGDIDAGRGAKSAISAPPPRITVDTQGNVVIDFGAAVAGSGIRTIVTADDVAPGDVDLIAPKGIVNAGDAGIGTAGNLNVAAQQVVGLDNIQVGGSSAGVPAETSNLGATLSSASTSSSSASASATSSVDQRSESTPETSIAQSALTWLDVFVEGFGDEVCKPDDAECLRRNSTNGR